MWINRTYVIGPFRALIGLKPSGWPYCIMVVFRYAPRAQLTLIDWRAKG